MNPRRMWAAIAKSALILGLSPAATEGSDIDQAPIFYGSATAENPVAAFQNRLQTGQAKLEYTEAHGYLPALLREFKVPISSQVFVFSKTSLQRNRISPRLPRALYFNDEVHVGYCRWGDVLEISVADTKLGTVFYTLEQDSSAPPKFTRQTDSCLMCHAASHHHGFPSHVIRSVYPDRDGNPILSSGTRRVDHSTPFEQRWGGWYVTGRHGEQRHLGNTTYRPSKGEAEPVRSDQHNIEDLQDHFDVRAYLAPHSDLVALMVLEHQGELLNRITRANFLTRQALLDATVMNELDGVPADAPRESSQNRIRHAVEPLIAHLFFADEAPLKQPIMGASTFTKDFAAIGPRTPDGRSLREFDLRTRLFKNPCSYLIYSPGFLQLPPAAKTYARQRIDRILSGAEESPDYAHLTAEQRRDIHAILVATHPDWQEGANGDSAQP